MKLYLKVIGCSCYTCLPRTALKMARGTGTDASLVAQRLLTIATPKQVHNHIHTCKQEKTLRNSTIVHKNSKQN